MKTYTLSIKARECDLTCSDGRSETFATKGRNDPRITIALHWCSVAGYKVKVQNLDS